MKRCLVHLIGLLLLAVSFQALAGFQAVPGATNPAVTPASLSATICNPGWADSVRPPTAYSSAVKRLFIRDEAGARSCIQGAYAASTEVADNVRWKKAVAVCTHKLGTKLTAAQAPQMKQYELNHHLPIQAGGAPWSIANLEMQPWSCAKQAAAGLTGKCSVPVKQTAEHVDVLERRLNRAVCDRRIPLVAAQQDFLSSWGQR